MYIIILFSGTSTMSLDIDPHVDNNLRGSDIDLPSLEEGQ